MASLKAKLLNLPPMRGSLGAARPAPPLAEEEAQKEPEQQAELFCGEPEPARARTGTSMAERLQRLQKAGMHASPISQAQGRPSLDELRDRIANIVGRGRPLEPRANPTQGELPFVLQQTELGPLYVRRERSAPAARVGRAPLVSARDAEASMLALLALDPRLSECDVKRALYVDTETTGLAGGTGTVPFLLGLSYFDEQAKCFVMEQLLLRRLGEEAPILSLFAERVEQASMLVSYNGKAFDMPLLKTRYVMNRLDLPPERPHLDLVHVARRIHKHRLKVRTLSALEHHVLGRVRVGDTHGEDIVACYAHFLRTGDEEALLSVVTHNEADVLSMVALVGLYGEPLSSLEPMDLAGVARTLKRAGAVDQAFEMADHAVLHGGGVEALKARGEIAKARGDKMRALQDFEAISSEVDDAGTRLALAKLYEHYAREFDKALKLLEQGTGEDDEALARRKTRLARKKSKRS